MTNNKGKKLYLATNNFPVKHKNTQMKLYTTIPLLKEHTDVLQNIIKGTTRCSGRVHVIFCKQLMGLSYLIFASSNTTKHFSIYTVQQKITLWE